MRDFGVPQAGAAVMPEGECSLGRVQKLKAFSWGALAGSSFLGLLSFGPLIALLFPITFVVGWVIGAITAGPWVVYLSSRTTLPGPIPFNVGSAVIGAFVPLVYSLLSHAFSGQAQFGLDWIPLLFLALPMALAYGVGGFVYWWDLAGRGARR